MKRVNSISFSFGSGQSVGLSEIDQAYNRIFEVARKRMLLDNKSTLEYSNTYETSGNVYDTRGSSQDDEGGTNNRLPNVQGQKNYCDKVWRSMENKPSKINEIIK